jgi:hypothetical protein
MSRLRERRKFRKDVPAKPEPIPARLGDGFGNLVYNAQANLYHARVAGRPEVVYNDRVAAQYDLEVEVGRDILQGSEKPGLFKVLSTRTSSPAGNQVQIQAGYAPASRYRFMADGGGQDPLWVEQRQIMPLSIAPVGETMVVRIYPGIAWAASDPIYVEYQTSDLTAHIPAGADTGALVLLTVGATGTLTATKGAEFTISTLTDVNDLLSHCPAAPSGAIYSAAIIRVYYGQTAVQETRPNTDIVDPRAMTGNGTLGLSKLANIAAYSILGNNTASAAAPSALTIAQVLALGGLATSVTAGKTLTLAATDDFTLTVPESLTVAGRNVANTFTAAQTIRSAGVSTNPILIRNSADTADIFYVRENSTGNAELNIRDAAGSAIIQLRSNLDSYINGVNFGLGTTAPLVQLHVNGKVAAGDSITSTRLNSASGPRAINLIDTSAVMRVWRFTSNTVSSPSIELISGTNNDAANAANVWWDITAWAPSSVESFFIRRRTGGVTTTPVTILSGGEFGLNTTAPGAKFQANGAASGITAILRANATTPGNILECQTSAPVTVASISAVGFGAFASVGVGAAEFFYLGAAAADGTWRIARNGNNLEFQRRESGAYVTKQVVSA